jgi:hypothetical protein
MVMSYFGDVQERTLQILLEKLREKGGEINLLSYDETGHVYDAKYLPDSDDDDIMLSMMESKLGIVSNTSVPYPNAHDSEIGLTLLNSISMETGDEQWGHLHLLHLMQNQDKWEDTLKNRQISRFCSMYLYKGELRIWAGLENILYATLYDGAYLFSNSLGFFKALPSEIYSLERRHLYVVSENITAYKF